jgi:hypothetical protein
MRQKIKVKIIKAKSEEYWYSNCIGNIYEVVDCDKFDYCDHPSGCLIGKEDCEIVSDDSTTTPFPIREKTLAERYKNLEISKVISFANWIGNERLYYSEVEGWWKLENGCIKNVAINTEVLLELFLTSIND